VGTPLPKHDIQGIMVEKGWGKFGEVTRLNKLDI
jgi:hypothetical protein